MNYPTPEENPMCQCKLNPMRAFWCPTGHMLECHFPHDCRTAACGHLERYEFTPEEISILEEQARERMRLPGSPYILDENNNVIANVATQNGEGKYKLQSRGVDMETGRVLTPWLDCERMPPFETAEAVEQWIVDNKARDLEKYGVQFRIVPTDKEEREALYGSDPADTPMASDMHFDPPDLPEEG
jgi:hypothetical protein